MDTDIRMFTVKNQIADRMHEAADERLAREAKACRAVDGGAGTGHPRRGLLRLALAAVALALAVASVRPAAAVAAVIPGGAVLFDPWPALAAVVAGHLSDHWDRAGLPRSADTALPRGAGTPVAGTASCTGLGCSWDLDDVRLDGAVAMREADGCPRAADAPGSAACPSGPVWLVGAVGGWAGSWSSFGPGDRLLVMAGTGAYGGLGFVGHWIDPGASAGWVTGVLVQNQARS